MRYPFCFPSGQLFEIHGSKLKPHPFGELGKTSIMRIAHTVLIFGIGKDSLNGFLAFGIKIFVLRGVSGVIGQFFVVFPNMRRTVLTQFLERVHRRRVGHCAQILGLLQYSR